MSLKIPHVRAVSELLDDGATVPFIARYRKEATGGLDETQVAAVRDRLHLLLELDSRKTAILNSLEKHGHLTDELKAAVSEAESLTKLEDIYLPYRPKRRTRAVIAKEKNLEPLADLILEQKGVEPEKEAVHYIDHEKGVFSTEDALAGARDIISEHINENQEIREKLRTLFMESGRFVCRVSKNKEKEGIKYKDYFQWDEPVSNAPSHRVLAMRRGEKEGILNLSVQPDETRAHIIIKSRFVKGDGPDSRQVEIAAEDSYKRLLSRSMETEVRLATKERADKAAIQVFTRNLRELLLTPPLGAKRVMGIDPGFRTGCKVVCLDRQGKLLCHDTIYPHTGEKKSDEAKEIIKSRCVEFEIEAIAVGNGTAGRETQGFIKSIQLEKPIPTVLVNESGASIYSASECARREFPDLDLTVRGSISIARRLMDPLAELVKIDPKSIGVGQYQHDVDQPALKKSLDDVVESCVNAVGVDVNRASMELLTYVSGLGPQLAANIVSHRNENGPFESRKNLKNVTRLGPKAFEQSAGFLRIPGGENPLDSSAVHPESYSIVDIMAKDLDSTVSDLMKKATLRKQINIQKYISDTVGLPTLKDIMDELDKPGRDPREAFTVFEFAKGINKISDLSAGMRIPGVVTNVTAFGAFVDIGVHQDGLVHISEMSDGYVKNPADLVKVHQKVNVRVLSIDLSRNRISLSMKAEPKPGKDGRKSLKVKKSEAKPARRNQGPFHNPFADLLKKNTTT
jgi:uncharacterized protein